MVSATVLVLIGGTALFFLAGGASLISPAVTQAKSDLSNIRSGVSSNVQNIKRTLRNRNDQDVLGVNQDILGGA